MKRFQHSFLSAMLLGATLLSGCATSTIYLQMSRTAGFVDIHPVKMYVVNIDGKDAKELREELYKALSKDGRFTTVGYGTAPPEKPDSATNMPSIILSGVHRTDVSTYHSTEGSGDNKKSYKNTTDTHEFQYSIRDAVTGEELYANVVRDEHVSKEEEKEEKNSSFLGAVVGGILQGALEELFRYEFAHLEQLSRHFVETLQLHQEQRFIGVFQDKDIPELKEGVEFVRKGDWAAAILKFQAGAESHPNSEALHKAYFNLGVAFEYNHEFDKALTSLRLADELAPQEGYAAEIDHCQRFARLYRWQQRYAGSSSEAPK